MVRTFLMSLVLLSLAVHASAVAPPTLPIITIDSEMHTARINSMAIDGDDQLLATASNDKTVKLWELKTGKFIRTIRPPVGDNNEGYLRAVAISPDGSIVAAGGETGYSWDKSFSVYIFSAATGIMQTRIHGLTRPINRLSYSGDGKFLAVGLRSGGGLAVYSTRDYTVQYADHSIPGSVTALEFDSNNELILATNKGELKRYRTNGASAFSIKTDGHDIANISISPDGEHVAIGYNDKAIFDMKNARDGSTSAKVFVEPDVRWHANPGGKFKAVAWAKDGNHFFATGNRSRIFKNKTLCVWNTNQPM